MSRGSSQPSRSCLVCHRWIEPCHVFLARHQDAAMAVTLPSLRFFSPFSVVELTGLREERFFLLQVFFVLRFLAGERETFTGRIRVHRNRSPLLFAAPDKPGSYLTVSPPFVFPPSFSLSFFPSMPSLCSPGWSVCLQLSRQLTAQWQVLRMEGWEAVEGEREGEGGRGTNERDSGSRGLSLHLQITAPPTLFDICPKWPGRSIRSLYRWGGGRGAY